MASGSRQGRLERRFTILTDRIVAAAHDAGRKSSSTTGPISRGCAGADGVHVGQTDLPVAEVRGIVGPDAIVGLSTHDRAQVDAALATDASYVAVGPIFSTATKETGYTARGLELVSYAAGRGKPVVAIGGITLERAPSVVAAGASAVAVISDILAGDDAEARVRAFLAALPAQPVQCIMPPFSRRCRALTDGPRSLTRAWLPFLEGEWIRIS